MLSPRKASSNGDTSSSAAAAVRSVSQQQQPGAPASRKLLLATSGQVLGVLAAPGLAVADEQAGDAGSFIDALLQSPDQLLVGALFTGAVVALTVLTAGVAYLSLGQWFDSRAEQEDRKRYESSSASRGVGEAARAAAGKKAPSAPAAAAKKKRKAGGGKGKGFS